MASNKVGEAYIEIRTDDEPMNKGLAKAKATATQWSSQFNEIVGRVGVAMAAGKFALGGVDGFKRSIMGAADLGETISKVGVVFGSATNDVTKFADEMAVKFGSNKQVMLDAASSIGLIGKAAGMSQPEAARMSASLARLADDASSFYNVPLPEALDAIRSALVGESEPIRKFGVLLNEDAVKAEALRLGVTKVGGAITEAGKVMARVSLIQKGMADATGDHERTMDSFSNKLREIQGRFENLQVEAGKLFMGVAQAVAWAANGIISALSGVVDVLNRINDFPADLADWWNGVADAAREAEQAQLDATGWTASTGGQSWADPKAPTNASKAKALDDQARAVVASQKESDNLKKRVEAIQAEEQLEAKKEANRKAEIAMLKNRRLDSWLIKERGKDGEIRDVIPESKRSEVDKLMAGRPTVDGLISGGKDKIGQVLGLVAELKKTAISGAATGANLLIGDESKPKGLLTGVTDSESYRRSAQDSILAGNRGDTQTKILTEAQKQVSELKAIKESLIKQSKGVVAAVFG